MTEEEYIAPILSSLNTIAVDRNFHGETASNGKTDVKSHFEDEIEKARQRFNRENNSCIPQDSVF